MSLVVSNLSLFVFLVALLDNVACANFSFRPPNSTCVWTERQLRKVIAKASNETKTRITLCRQTVSISNTRNPDNSTGIDLTDRFIDIGCYLKRRKGTCTLDGMGSSRIFKGQNAALIVRNVLFKNAKPNECDPTKPTYTGGAIDVVSSNVSLMGCSFIDNGCFRGGAIAVKRSTLMISGGSRKWPVVFSGNKGPEGAALSADQSKVSVHGYTTFSNNFCGEGGAVDIFESTFSIRDAMFVDNSGTTSALFSDSSNSSIKNVNFIGKVAGALAIWISESSLHAMNCTFQNHKDSIFSVWNSKVTLKNSTFSNNTVQLDEGITNIYINDDNDPSLSGTFVKCESNVVFCDGLVTSSITEVVSGNNIFSNTDCYTEGLQGTPGQGSCPI